VATFGGYVDDTNDARFVVINMTPERTV